MSTSESEIEDRRSRRRPHQPRGSSHGLEHGSNDEQISPFSASFQFTPTRQASPVTVPKRVYSPFDTTKEINKQRNFSGSDTTLAVLSPLARNPSVVSSLRSFPSTGTMRSSPSNPVEQTHKPEILSLPIDFQLQEPADSALAREQLGSHPESPRQQFWRGITGPRTGEGLGVPHEPYIQQTYCEQDTPCPELRSKKVRIRQPSMHRYSTIPTQYQEPKAPKVPISDGTDSASEGPGLARNGVSYEGLRKGQSIHAQTPFDFGLDLLSELQQSEDTDRWRGDDQRVRRKQSRTLIKPRPS